MKKKLVAILMATAMTAALVACSNSNATSDTKPENRNFCIVKKKRKIKRRRKNLLLLLSRRKRQTRKRGQDVKRSEKTDGKATTDKKEDSKAASQEG